MIIAVPHTRNKTLGDKDVFERFVLPGEVVEVRIIGAFGKDPAWGEEFAKGTVSGYFDDHEAFCNAVREADKTGNTGIYFTLQVIDPRLLGRAMNRLKAATLTTADHNVLAYRWLPIDIDPIRPSGISSSDSELLRAMELRDEVAQWVMREKKFPAPIKAMSGNGAHLLFRLPDLPVTEQHRRLIKDILENLAKRFNSPEVEIDQKVFNPSRIWKLYGTTSHKGDLVPANQYREARPHRRSFIDDLGKQGECNGRSDFNGTNQKLDQRTPSTGVTEYASGTV